jgi:hypothetical protein
MMRVILGIVMGSTCATVSVKMSDKSYGNHGLYCVHSVNVLGPYPDVGFTASRRDIASIALLGLFSFNL